MKKLILSVFLAIASVGMYAQSTSNAEAHRGAADKGAKEGMLENLKTELNLTPDQYTAVKKILADTKIQHQKNEETYKTDEQAKMKANKALRQQTDQKIMALLDANQQAKFTAMKEEKKEEMKEKHNDESPEVKAAKRTEELVSVLSLTSEQTTKIKEIYKNAFTQIAQIKAKFGNDEEAAKDQIKPIKKDAEMKIEALLTDAQKAKYKAYKEEKKH